MTEQPPTAPPTGRTSTSFDDVTADTPAEKGYSSATDEDASAEGITAISAGSTCSTLSLAMSDPLKREFPGL